MSTASRTCSLRVEEAYLTPLRSLSHPWRVTSNMASSISSHSCLKRMAGTPLGRLFQGDILLREVVGPLVVVVGLAVGDGVGVGLARVLRRVRLLIHLARGLTDGHGDLRHRLFPPRVGPRPSARPRPRAAAAGA